MRGSLLAMCALATPWLHAQPPSLFVPVGGPSAEGNSAGALAGLAGRARQQVLLAARLLAPFRGTSLTAIEVRRDRALGIAFPAGSSRLVVMLSDGAAHPSAASEQFARNHGSKPVVVFRGTVPVPASPAPTGPIGWDARNTVRIPFSTPFRYRSGALCLEIQGEPIAPPARFVWMVDYVHEAEPGTVREVGTGCGAPATHYRPPASAWERQLVPGGTLSVVAFGRAGTAGTMLFSDRLLQPPIPLDPLGAPGCRIRVAPLVTSPLSYVRAGLERITPAAWRVQLPASPTLLAARFYAQAANLEGSPKSNPLGITTTNALELGVARSMPPGRIATVISDDLPPGWAFPATGRVEPGRGPILRLVRK